MGFADWFKGLFGGKKKEEKVEKPQVQQQHSQPPPHAKAELPKGEKFYSQSLRKTEDIRSADEKLAALNKHKTVDDESPLGEIHASEGKVMRGLSQEEIATPSQEKGAQMAAAQEVKEAAEIAGTETQHGGFGSQISHPVHAEPAAAAEVQTQVIVKEPVIQKEEAPKPEIKEEPKVEPPAAEAKAEPKAEVAKPAAPAPTPAPAAEKAQMKKLSKKVCLIGDGGSGKTTLIRKFVYDMFDDKYIHTIGTKVTKKVVTLPEENIELTLMLWDIQGQKNDLGIKAYMEGAEGALVVSDVTRLETLDHIPDWIVSFFEVSGQVPVIILGNKSDLVDRMLFGTDELQFLVNKLKKQGYNAQQMLTSAKTGLNVEQAFTTLGKEIAKKSSK